MFNYVSKIKTLLIKNFTNFLRIIFFSQKNDGFLLIKQVIFALKGFKQAINLRGRQFGTQRSQVQILSHRLIVKILEMLILQRFQSFFIFLKSLNLLKKWLAVPSAVPNQNNSATALDISFKSAEQVFNRCLLKCE